jgi:Domain of unknown function (DUF4159)
MPAGSKAITTGAVACVLVAVATAALAQRWTPRLEDTVGPPEAEFQMVRVAYSTRGGCAGSRGWCNDWWAIDYPYAEQHFLPAVGRLTRIEVSEDSRQLEITNPRIFDYPWLFMQQVGQGNWNPSEREAALLREYLDRGGFLVVDDFHGEYEWAIFQNAIQTVLPGRPIIEIPPTDMLNQILFSLDQRTQIPGERHLRYLRMAGPPHWRGIYDDEGRLMVAINHNIDMGDAWEHADDPHYPAPMTALAYRFGVNYVIYAMTH